jgi:hypothetical protein
MGLFNHLLENVVFNNAQYMLIYCVQIILNIYDGHPFYAESCIQMQSGRKFFSKIERSVFIKAE